MTNPERTTARLPRESQPHSRREKTIKATTSPTSPFTELLQSYATGRTIEPRKVKWFNQFTQKGKIPRPAAMEEILKLLDIDPNSEDGHKLQLAAQAARRARIADIPSRRDALAAFVSSQPNPYNIPLSVIRRQFPQYYSGSYRSTIRNDYAEVKDRLTTNEPGETTNEIEQALREAERAIRAGKDIRPTIDPASVLHAAQDILEEARKNNRTITQGELAMAVVLKLNRTIPKGKVIEILTPTEEDDPIGFLKLPPTITGRKVDDWYEEERQKNNP